MENMTKEEQRDFLAMAAEESGLNKILTFKGQSNAKHYESYRFYRKSGLYGIEFWGNAGLGFYGDADFFKSISHAFIDHPKLKRIHGKYIEFQIDTDFIEICKMIIPHIVVDDTDIETDSINRDIIERETYDSLDSFAKWRYDEIDRIKTSINDVFGGKSLFAFEHAKTIKEHGSNAIHPDNIQLMVQRENSVKNGTSMKRMSWEEQVEEIEFYMSRTRYNLDDSQKMIINKLIIQLKSVYEL
ncbi:hypothetical protein [Endozoicomonas sp. SCSIO W0465]|uniref:hypothetical protein n=1 Tax=Endozoicomonas sp. SCSIO W0465 TaxID=2918516 RepID=UPI002074CBF5|nr:hypothetical protein [Endozoicomonas sp. SCSIO W0465]USE39523.1 hypothetical protein MJO57_15975 [Endozoicomonas sp. SCSIO W0465]